MFKKKNLKKIYINFNIFNILFYQKLNFLINKKNYLLKNLIKKNWLQKIKINTFIFYNKYFLYNKKILVNNLKSYYMDKI